MINVHFFGCSLTAGDELSDDELFPWKHECKDAQEYYSRRVLPGDYELRNKKFAYPALMKSLSINTTNHAHNGAGIRENILNLIEVISTNSKIDCLYFQIPPYGRELVIINDRATTIQLAWNEAWYKEYLEAKRKSHSLMQYSLEDFMDLITLHGYLKSQGIKHKFIELENWVNELRITDLQKTRFSFLVDEYYKLPRLILSDALSNHPRTIGGHYDKHAHIEIARIINEDLIANNIL
jgi:hypothetical protein